MTTSHQKEQAERLALAGSTTGMTYHSRAITGLELERSGRHAQSATITGTKAVPQYPAASGPWNDPVQVPDEPPLSYSVEDLEVTGNYHEVEASSREASPSVASLPPDGDVATASAIPSPGALGVPAVSTSAAGTSTSSSDPGLRRGRRL
jgi:hypothetical protein